MPPVKYKPNQAVSAQIDIFGSEASGLLDCDERAEIGPDVPSRCKVAAVGQRLTS
jgi:hypothetical protein